MAKRRNALPIRPHRKRGLPNADGKVMCDAERMWIIRKCIGIHAWRSRNTARGQSDYEKQMRAKAGPLSPGQEPYVGWWWDAEWDPYCTPMVLQWQWPQDRHEGSPPPPRESIKGREPWPWEVLPRRRENQQDAARPPWELRLKS